MNAISPLVDHILNAAGWAVIHSVWQGAGIGGLSLVLITGLPRNAAVSRYNTALIALLACAAAFAVTFSIELTGSFNGPRENGFDRIADLGRFSQSASIHAASSRAWFIDAVAIIWALGGVWMSLRVLRQCLALHRLKAPPLSLADEPWLDMFAALKKQLGIDPAVRLMRSGSIDVPMVVGWLAPVVLVPACAFTSLSREQMRALLVHELSHIRRCDHWVNVIQIMIETVLFYHPVVWWLSRQMRIERENCCDDAAVQSIGSPRIFAEALVQLETLRNPVPLALSSQGGSLMNRIARMLGTPDQNLRPMPRLLPALAGAVLVVASLVGMSHASVSNTRPDSPAIDMLKDAVAAGRISADEARNIYNKIAYPGSDAEQRIEAERRGAMGVIERQIAAGQISREDADKKLNAMRARIDEEQQIAFAIDVLGKTRQEAQFDSLSTHLDAQVAAGKITADEAQRKLAAWKDHVADADQATAELERAIAVLHAKVQAGEISAEEARIQHSELRKRVADLFQQRAALNKLTEFRVRLDTGEIVSDGVDNTRSKQDIENQIAALQRQAESGAISAQDAKARIMQLKERSAALAEQRMRLEKVSAELKAQVDAGKISADEAAEKLKAHRIQLITEKRDIVLLERIIQDKATVEQKLELARVESDQAAADEEKRRVTLKLDLVRDQQRQALDKFSEDLKAQVAAGKLTKEEAEAKLDALKADIAKRSGQ